MGDILQLDNICKSFGSVTVADKLSLSLHPGEALGVIGPNGAGKTTMFNLITGDLQPGSGRILAFGKDITGLDPAERCRGGIGRSYQIPHPFVGMSVYENLLVGAVFGAGKPEPEASAIAIDILGRTGLMDKCNARAGTLTLLDRKRLELARAMATQPKILLLDEIAGGLTEHEVHELVETINTLREGGVAIIWIEHIVHALLAVVDRIVAINFGRVLKEGRPAEVMASPEVQEVYLGIDVE